MITPDEWVRDALAGLQSHFGPRLRYVGLQGSYRRGEASETSDIDLVVLLDSVSLDDLDIYRTIMRALPEGEKACGFIAGVSEFLAWPKHELFPFRMDTRDYFGKLDDFMPSVERSDIEENVRIGASGLYHMLTHRYLYADETSLEESVRALYKSAGFIVIVKSFLDSGIYSASRAELLERVTGFEKEIVSIGIDFTEWVRKHSLREAVLVLREWCREVLLAA